MPNYDIFPLFSIPVYKSNVTFTSYEEDTIKNLIYKSLSSGVGKRTDEISNPVLENVELKELKSQVNYHIDTYAHKVLCVKDQYKFTMTNSWVFLLENDDYGIAHSHSYSLISGIVYIQAEENCGNVVFYKNSQYLNTFPPMYPLEYDDYNIYNSSNFYFTPNKYDIILFPSHLVHNVEKNLSSKGRYCLAFDVMVEGAFKGSPSEDTVTFRTTIEQSHEKR